LAVFKFFGRKFSIPQSRLA